MWELVSDETLTKIICLSTMAALWLWACSGEVEVTGVPKKIQLEAPFCVPDKDAGDAG